MSRVEFFERQLEKDREPIRLIDKQRASNLNVLQTAIFFVCTKYSLVPEIYEFLGKEKFLDFLERFAGTTLKIPYMEDILKAIRDADIHARLSVEHPKQTSSLLTEDYDSLDSINSKKM